MEKRIISAKCISHAFESKNALQFYPGDTVEIDLADKYQRRLVWLKTTQGPRGKWVFEFDRANSSDPMIRLWFCKDCGEPFDQFAAMGNHVNAEHGNKAKREVAEAQEFEAAQEEERIVAQLQQREIDQQLERAKALVARLEQQKGPVVPEIEAAPEEPIVTERRGKQKKIFTCKHESCREVLPNLYALRMHYKAHEAAATEVQEPQSVST